MYKSDVATNIRSSDWEVLGKNDVFFDRSSGRKGDSHGGLFFCQIRTGSFSKEFRCCSARNKFRTGAFPRIFNRTLPFNRDASVLQLVKDKKNAMISQ